MTTHRQPRYISSLDSFGGALMAAQYLEALGYPTATDRGQITELAKFIAPLPWRSLRPRERLYIRCWAKRLIAEISIKRVEAAQQG